MKDSMIHCDKISKLVKRPRTLWLERWSVKSSNNTAREPIVTSSSSFGNRTEGLIVTKPKRYPVLERKRRIKGEIFLVNGILACIPFHTWCREPLLPGYSPSVAGRSNVLDLIPEIIRLSGCLLLLQPSGRWHAVSNANRMPRPSSSFLPSFLPSPPISSSSTSPLSLYSFFLFFLPGLLYVLLPSVLYPAG